MTANELQALIQQTAAEKQTSLNLSYESIKYLPPEIASLQSLRVLNLNHNQLSSLPPEIASLQNLQVLLLNDNQLNRLPPEIASLQNLQELYLKSNQLRNLPPEIASLQNLQELYLKSNQLRNLPPEMAALQNLQYLDLENNPFNIPPEILQQYHHPTKIIRYYLQTQIEKAPLNEAKMLIVGQGGVGKTSLLNRLTNQVFDEQESKTEGINIKPWCLPIKKVGENQEVTLHIWDFGGQEIMHATHQFFLTKRSLYLVLLDARQGEKEGRLEYWLKLIQSFGGDSPVIVVINKIDAHPLDVNERFLENKYRNIRAFIGISCQEQTNIDKLMTLIHDCVAAMPHVFDPFPQTWFELKQNLADLGDDYISYENYQNRCQENDISDERDQEILIGFLHDLGIALNFRDDPRLQDTSVLNPEWVTSGIYQLLNSHRLFHAQGMLQLADMAKILDSQRYPRGKHLFIIELMKEFELCFSLPDKQGYLLPDLLPKNEPDVDHWRAKECLCFEYHYDVLPSSVFLRAMVRLHTHIYDKNYWYSGVVLRDGENKALLRADYEDKKICIWIDGHEKSRRAMLGLIRGQFEYIHSTIAKLIVKEKIPYQGEALDYDDLLVYEKHGEMNPFIPKLKQKVDVVRLLDGIDENSRTNLHERQAAYAAMSSPPVVPPPAQQSPLIGISLAAGFNAFVFGQLAQSPWFALAAFGIVLGLGFVLNLLKILHNKSPRDIARNAVTLGVLVYITTPITGLVEFNLSYVNFSLTWGNAPNLWVAGGLACLVAVWQFIDYRR